MTRRHVQAAAGLIVLSWLLLTALVFDAGFIFHGDHERDLRYVTLWVQHGHFPEASPAIAPYPFELGPMSYVLLAPAVAISPDPLIVRWWIWLLAAAGALVFFDLLRRHVRPEAALLSLFALLSSTFFYELSRQLWHSSLLPLPLALFLWTAVRLLDPASVTHRRDAWVCAAMAAVSVQLHLTAAVYSALALGVAILSARRLGLRNVTMSIGAYLVALSPMVWTLKRSIDRGALESLDGRSGPPWSPASPLEVLEFFVDNVHTIWGDNLGPFMTWPLLGLLGVGIVVALKRRSTLGLLLVANLAIGFVAEAALLGNQQAHRYMHANMFAAFGLIAMGASHLFDALKSRPGVYRGTLIATAVLGGVIAAEAALSPIPHHASTGWLSAHEQRAVARTLAAEIPMDSDDAASRIHGIFFGETMGLGHYHAITPREDAAVAGQVLVMPTDLNLSFHGEAIQTYSVTVSDRPITVIVYTSHLAQADLMVRSQAADALLSKWRRAKQQGPPTAPGLHEIAVPNSQPGRVHFGIADGRRVDDQCTISATLGSTGLWVEPVAAPGYSAARFVAFDVPAAGLLTVRLGPCQVPTWWDLW